VHAGPGQNDLLSAGGATLQNDALGLASKTTGTSTTSYVRDNAGKVISQLNGTNRRYWLTDERGSLIAATDSDGKITSAYKFDPYGRPIGSPHDTLGYAGGVRAPGDLIHFGARYYNPQDGRWTQQDPLNQAGDLREANRYVYVGADPINLSDPRGTHVFGGLLSSAREVLRGGNECYGVTLGFQALGATGFAVGLAAGATGVAAGTVAGVSYCAIRVIDQLDN